MNIRHLTISLLLISLAVAAPALAAPLYEMRVDGNGIPMILASSKGYIGSGNNMLAGGTLMVTGEGYVVVKEAPSSAHAFQVLDPALASANNAPGDANSAYIRLWLNTQELYNGSVPGGVKVGDGDAIGGKGMTRPLPDGSFLAWTGGGTIDYRQVQLQDSNGDYDPTAGTAARLAAGSVSLQSSYHKRGLEMWGPAAAADTWLVLGGIDTNQGIVKTEWGPLTGLEADASGTRTITPSGNAHGWLIGGSGNSRTSLIADLVPDISDTMREFAYNPFDGNLYILSVATNRVFLSAISFDWGETTANSTAAYVDLNPDDATKNYIELTYDSGDSFPDLLNATGLGFSPDGATLYISSGTRVFIFDNSTPIPEPATMAFLALGGLAMAGTAVRRARRRAV